MPQPVETVQTTGECQLAMAFQALTAETPGALDQLAQLAVRYLEQGAPQLAAASAGAVVLVEHLQAARYRHAPSMLAVLAAFAPVAPHVVGADPHGLLVWAGAAVARDYGVFDSWPEADFDKLLEQARLAPADVALALGCALGEVCERNGRDADFAVLQAQMASHETQADASPFWRGHWAIIGAWHQYSFGRRDAALAQLERARKLAVANGLNLLGTVAILQRARLIEYHRDPAKAAALISEALAHGDPAGMPLWWADQADILCRIAIQAGDFHAAIGGARYAMGYLQAAGVWPAYTATYRLNEAYALFGAGAIDAALERLHAFDSLPMPPYLAARIKCLVDLLALSAAEKRGPWTALLRADLADVLGRLRELEWPNVLPLLAEHVASLFVRALVDGVEVDWVRAAIRTRGLAPPRDAPENWPWAARVYAMGSFRLVTESGPLREALPDSRKASSKPLDLLRLLAAQGYEAVLTEQVAETLWPGDGREGRQKTFDVTVGRLRTLLGSDTAVRINDRRIRLEPRCVWIDAQALTDRLSESDAAADRRADPAASLEAALTLYRGPFLAGSKEAWAVLARDRLRSRLAASLLRATRLPGIDKSLAQEWILRALSTDRCLDKLLNFSSAN